MDVLGIDFGTSNTVAVLAGAGRPPRVLAIDGSGWIQSCVYIDDDGTLAVGRDAERKARLSPERYEANPKRRIDDGEILLGVRIVSVVDAIAAVLHRVLDEARRQLNGRSPDQINLTHPAEWGPSRRNVLLTAARAAGLGPAVSLLPEPVAAAAHFWALPDRQFVPGSSLAVYDLGGGTFDCAVVGSTPSGFLVLAEAGLATVGGVDFDQAVIDSVGRTVSGQNPARWQALTRPRNAADRRAARTLREDVRAAKETLSRYAQTDLSLPDPFDDTLLTRREFEGLVRPVLARTVEILSGTVGRAGLTADQLGGIYLVGGSSRIPLVATMIAEQLGIVPTTLDQPETAVAMGAALMPVLARQQGRTDGVEGQPAQPNAGGARAADPGVRPDGPPPTRPTPEPGTAGRQQEPFDGGRPFGGPPGTGSPTGVPAAFGGADRPAGRRPRRRRFIVLAAVAVLVIAAVVLLIATRSGSGPTDVAGRTDASAATVRTAPSAGTSRASDTSGAARSSSRSTSVSGTRSSTSASTASTSSTPTGTLPAGCATADANTGLTACMKQVIGRMADLNCSKNPSAIGLADSALKDLQTLTTAFATCIDSDKGFAAVVFQTTTAATRDALGPAVRSQFTQDRSGNWRTADRAGEYSAGRTTTGISLLEWEDSNLPIVAFVGATKGASSDETVNYWKSALGATTS